MNSPAPPVSPPPRRPPGLLRRLLRSLGWTALVLLVLAAPTLAYHARWSWPRAIVPAVGTAQEQQRAAAGMDPELAARLMAIVRDARATSGLPSLSAAVARTDGLDWAGASGWADIDRGQAAGVASRYRTGSIAKPITAVAMMRLAEAGALDLDAPGADAVAGLPPALAPLTARQLASHTAGVRHYSPMPYGWLWPGWFEANSQRHYPSVEAGLAMFADDRLRFAPGTGFQYSTFGYSLLSRLLEGASGRPFPELLAAQVFAPAGMTGTAVDTPDAMPDRVAFYVGEGGRYTAARPVDSSFRIAGGGMVSTPADLARLGVALQDGRLLSAEGIRAMWTAQPLADGSANPQNYALGWRVDQSTRLFVDGRPLQVVHHGGTQAGAAAFLLLVPEQGLAVAVMANSISGRAQVQDTALVLAQELLQVPAKVEATPGAD
ncbi:beta-lactamase family protein [Pseudoxanthomonas daejeonensis]|uniref:serine hydrolase domain-containing protein n=1 Tax=Pseudoxanthomonas daejeonensis TaxID=266062 RepID=UPI001F543532|nr:serine hydrolase domain-containing protein [Pseudoxanthomonas daejeonensis]UNK58812.1 beta-lactamase family protein [Pseudoxanthomonas daejeonensis]